jgi:hypothetical protein
MNNLTKLAPSFIFGKGNASKKIFQILKKKLDNFKNLDIS